ncbi:MAG: tyrosine-type recombinase/integrase [Gammaproteobacteria bacterium]|nr:tyrosine-type recombinase/integrase [Gammaproteobacteria bacterium]
MQLPTTIDQLTMPGTLSGTHGFNRANRNACQITADDDLAAIRTWLSEYQDSPQTFRNYRKEAERLLLWAMIERGKPLSDLNRDDFIAYEQFLADPQPAEKWCGPRYPRNSEQWRPFQGPLKPQSQRQALVIIQSLLGYLVEAGYLAANPFALRRRRLPKAKQDDQVIERYLEKDLWEYLYNFVIDQAPSSDRERSHYERSRYLLSLLYLLTPRVSEIANHTMGSFREREGKWWWHVTGKGEKTQRIPVNTAMLEALLRYRQHLKLAPRPQINESTPLILNITGTRGISANMIYRIVKKLAQAAADTLESSDPVKADKLRQASTHWFRHTGLTHQLDSGMDLRFVNKNARHAKMETTSIYLHAEDTDWSEAMETHVISEKNAD